MNKRTLGVNYTRDVFDMLCNLAYVKNESRSTALSRLIEAVNRETCLDLHEVPIFFSHLR